MNTKSQNTPAAVLLSENQFSTVFIRNYFYWASILLLILAVVAFSDNLFFDVRQKSNADPKFIIHGLFFLAWFIVLVVQTRYINKKSYKAHVALGVTGMLIALGVILSTFYVFAAVYKGWDTMSPAVRANRILTISFAMLVYMAYKYRKNAIIHKRLLYMGTIYTLRPVLDRVADKIGVVDDPYFFIFQLSMWNLFFLSLFLYDWMTLKKLHPISWIGYLWFYIIWVVTEFYL